MGGDPAVAAKALNGFATEHPDALTVKGGLLDGRRPGERGRRPAGPAARRASSCWASWPAASPPPLSGLAGSLSNLIGGLARSLASLQAQREAEAPSD